MISRCEKKGVESVFDVLEMEDTDREKALQLDARRMADVAMYCNRYPAVDVQYKVVRVLLIFVLPLFCN